MIGSVSITTCANTFHILYVKTSFQNCPLVLVLPGLFGFELIDNLPTQRINPFLFNP